MPAFMKIWLKQLSIEEANASRIVTKVRWAVEAIHGKIIYAEIKKLNKNNDYLNEKSLLNKRLVFKTTILINYQ